MEWSVDAYLGFVNKLPTNDRHDENGDSNVRCDKVGRRPVALEEHRESSNKSDDGGANESEPGSVGLERRLPRQRVSADALDLECTVEADVAEAQRRPSDEAGNSAEVKQPSEGLRRTTTSKT